MSIPIPDDERILELSSHYGFGVGPEVVEQYTAAVAASLTSFDEVDRLYARIAPGVPNRPYRVSEDRSRGWAVTTDITETTEGPLAGRAIAIKDNVAVAGIPMDNGSPAVAGFVPSRDATAVRRLLDAGATIAGKSVCEDLCFSGASFTSWPVAVRNPWDRARTAGGSSSGSAALVAAGEVDLALGGDQGGSVRIPASFTGIVGLKPTHGLVPYTGAFPIESTIDHLGPMTRTVADAALMLDIIAGPDGFDPRQSTHVEPTDHATALGESVAGLRIGVLREGFGTPVSDPGVDQSVRDAVERLTGVGLAAEEVSVPWHLQAKRVWDVIATEGTTFQMLDGNAYGMNSWGLYDPELIAHYARQRVERGPELSTTVKVTAMAGRHSFERGGGTYYAKARNLAYEVRAAYDAALADYDVLVLPTTPFTAQELPVVSKLSVTEYVERALGMLGNTAAFDVTGHPAISVPAGLVGGLPAGMMIVGRRFDEATVLRVAHAFERLAGGFPRPTAADVLAG